MLNQKLNSRQRMDRTPFSGRNPQREHMATKHVKLCSTTMAEKALEAGKRTHRARHVENKRQDAARRTKDNSALALAHKAHQIDQAGSTAAATTDGDTGAGYVNNNYSRRMRSGRQRQPTHTDEPAKQAQVAFDMSSSNKDTCKPQAADSDNNGELVTLDTQVHGLSLNTRNPEYIPTSHNLTSLPATMPSTLASFTPAASVDTSLLSHGSDSDSSLVTPTLKHGASTHLPAMSSPPETTPAGVMEHHMQPDSYSTKQVTLEKPADNIKPPEMMQALYGKPRNEARNVARDAHRHPHHNVFSGRVMYPTSRQAHIAAPTPQHFMHPGQPMFDGMPLAQNMEGPAACLGHIQGPAPCTQLDNPHAQPMWIQQPPPMITHMLPVYTPTPHGLLPLFQQTPHGMEPVFQPSQFTPQIGWYPVGCMVPYTMITGMYHPFPAAY